MAGFDQTLASDVAKNQYLGPVNEALNQSTILLSKIKRKESTQGKNITFPVHYGRNTSAGLGVAEGGTLPTAGSQLYKAGVIPLVYQYGRLQLTGQVIASTRNDKGAFVRAIGSEMKSIFTDFKRAKNRQLHGNGLDVLAYATSAISTTNTYTLDDGNGFGYVHIPSGQSIQIDILNPATFASKVTVGSSGYPTATAGASTATGVSVTITVGAGTSVSGGADNDLIVPAFQSSSTITGTTPNRSKQMMGLEGIISASDPAGVSTGLHGLDVSTYPFWSAQTVGSDSSFVDLKTSDLQKVFTKIESNSDFTADDVEFILCSPQLRDKYAEVCIAERRTTNSMKLDNGFSAVTFNTTPIVVDPQCKHGRFYFVVPETMGIFQMGDLAFMEEDGAVWSRVANQDGYEATLYHYANLGCTNRNGNGVLLGCNE